MSILTRILGDANERYLEEAEKTVEKVNSLEEEFEAFSDRDLRKKTKNFKDRLSEDSPLKEILPEAFALVREAAKRTLDQRHYDEQIVGGLVLHEGKIAEMKTGEGKTLAATLPAYLNALKEKGVHIVTVNDYLARRDTVWMGQIYHKLGLETGCLNHRQAFVYNPEYEKEEGEKDQVRDRLGGFKVVQDFLEPCSRREAYEADITYGTNNEFGFDYLRDNMVKKPEEKVQRGFHFAILDEVDFILIDEARTPLIISRPGRTPSELYHRFKRVVGELKPGLHFEVDEEKRAVSLTQQGIDEVEEILGEENIYEKEGIDYLHHLEQALRAQAENPADGKPLFAKDRDYVVREGEVVIVDEFTGRLMPGRRWSGGLHQAIEAKEGVDIEPESQTRAQITFQNLFRLYDKLSGMTGTAVSGAEEFDRVYNLEVISIPTHRPDIREDLSDRIYKNKEAKFRALIEEIKNRHQKGQPLLVGTRSIEKNEKVARLLEEEGIQPAVLNAKHHEKEARIVAQAGSKGTVTVATNMAGRGVDIVLGGNPPDKEEQEEVKKLGGLHVIGTERHEARRIDNQLRGRAGRQGDPGSSQFFLSLEDELLRVFGGERLQAVMERLQLPEEEPIEAGIVSRAVKRAQEKIEGLHFDARKRLLEYDDVLSRHREVFYEKREEILTTDPGEFRREVASLLAEESVRARFSETGPSFLARCRRLYLEIMDFYWMRHLEDMDWLKDSVRLKTYANLDPLVEYKKEGYEIFREMLAEIEKAMTRALRDLLEEEDLASKVGKKILEEPA